MYKRKKTLSTTQVMLLSFLITILLGSVVLSLPISAADGQSVSYLDALFTATTSTCVTGLVTLPTYATWSVFGQVVILILIQIGGLGVVTITSAIMMIFQKKMWVGDRLLIQDAFNLNTMEGLVKFIKSVVLGTLLIEGVGAVLYMIVFIPEFGIRGIWISVFNSVSAFCNAGMDIIGGNSLCNYATNPFINFITSSLIVLGGLGYIVWWDLLRVIRDRTGRRKKWFQHLTLHSKVVLVTTTVLIFGGAALIFACEYSNPLTLGGFGLFDKIQVSFFQSITTRTAGFATIPQENLTGAGSVVSLILMVVGGSPVGTAGGIKTVTIVVLLCSTVSTIRGKKQAIAFNRAFSGESIRKAVAVLVMFLGVALTSIVLLAMAMNASIIDVVYESVSATATVGLSKNLTASLNVMGKIVIIATMYFGRVGPISFAVALGSRRETQNVVSDPEEQVSIG